MQIPVYLDYNSTTPVDPRVLEAMLPFYREHFGNAASKTHAYGWIAEEVVKQSRLRVAELIHAEPAEIIFTSGATEAINLALKGAAEAYRSGRNHLITVTTEHKAVLDTCRHLEKNGMHITYLPVDHQGMVDLELLRKSITDETILVCVMLVNNETGVMQPLKEIAEIVHRKKCLLMSDATQACGRMKTDVQEYGIDLLCLSAHKFYGPKGTGALYVRRKNPRVVLSPLIDGGGHENGLRSGTLNVPAIAGLGKACEIAMHEMHADGKRISVLRNRLETALIETTHAEVNGSMKKRMYNVMNLSLKGISAAALIGELKDVALSTGSACTSAVPEPSHVLKAMGLDAERAFSSIRFSLGKFTTEEEIEFTIKRVKNVVAELKRGVD